MMKVSIGSRGKKVRRNGGSSGKDGNRLERYNGMNGLRQADSRWNGGLTF